MSGTSMRAPGKGRNYEIFWKTVFFIGLFATMFGLYWATQQVDYVWRWERIPNYFYYEDEIDTTATIEGSVTAIKEQGKNGHRHCYRREPRIRTVRGSCIRLARL